VIDGVENYSDYCGGGRAVELKEPKYMDFVSIRDLAHA